MTRPPLAEALDVLQYLVQASSQSLRVMTPDAGDLVTGLFRNLSRHSRLKCPIRLHLKHLVLFLSCSRFGPLDDAAYGLKCLSSRADEMFFLATVKVTKVRTASSSSVTTFSSCDAAWLNSGVRSFRRAITLVCHMQDRWHEGLERYSVQRTADQQLPTRLLLSLVQDVLPLTSGIRVPSLAARCPLGLLFRTVHDSDPCKKPSSHLSPLGVETLHTVTHQSCHGSH